VRIPGVALEASGVQTPKPPPVASPLDVDHLLINLPCVCYRLSQIQCWDSIEIVLSPAMTTRPAEEIASSSPSATVATIQEVVTMHEFAEPAATPFAISVVEPLSPIPNCVKLTLKMTTHHVASV
jgi:hypothetical protein